MKLVILFSILIFTNIASANLALVLKKDDYRLNEKVDIRLGNLGKSDIIISPPGCNKLVELQKREGKNWILVNPEPNSKRKCRSKTYRIDSKDVYIHKVDLSRYAYSEPKFTKGSYRMVVVYPEPNKKGKSKFVYSPSFKVK